MYHEKMINTSIAQTLDDSCLYTRGFLLSVKRNALRRGVWFKSLDGLERSIINLTCAVVENVNSITLIREIMEIVLKLKNAAKGEFLKLTETIGVQRAWKVSELSFKWGNKDALFWRDDLIFHMFHAMIEINSPTGCRQ